MHGGHMSVRQTPGDLERLSHVNERLTGQHRPDRRDRLGRQHGQIGQRFLGRLAFRVAKRRFYTVAALQMPFLHEAC